MARPGPEDGPSDRSDTLDGMNELADRYRDRAEVARAKRQPPSEQTRKIVLSLTITVAVLAVIVAALSLV